MFAPPPIQLSRDEIESRLSEESRTSPISPNGDAKSLSLLRKTSPVTSPRRNHYFGKGEKVQVSSPITLASQNRFRDVENFSKLQSAARADIERLYSLPPGFAESPRKAPTPPTRRLATRPADLRLPSSQNELSGPTAGQPVTPQRSDIAPPIPPKSLKRQSLTGQQEDAQSFSTGSLNIAGNSHPAEGNVVRSGHLEPPQSYQRAYIIPSDRPHIASMAQQSRGIGKSMAGLGLYVGSAGGTPKLFEGSEGESPKQSIRILPMDTAVSPARRYLTQQSHFLSKELPDTPVGKAETPTEVYQSLESFQLSPSKRRGRRTKRTSPTSPPFTEGEKVTLPNRLSAIMEDSNTHERSPTSSESSTPTATLMHLRGGSLVTVTPPELTPWMRYVYVQEPIRMRAPVSMPRNPSVASLEPFQDAIDGFHKATLHIPRRRSDDQVLDDVCNFFDGFGFDSVSFGGDVFVSQEMLGDGGTESVNGAEDEIERFSTPPAEPERLNEAEHMAEATRAALNAQQSHSLPSNASEGVFRRKSEADTMSRNAAPHGRKDSATLAAGLSRILSPHR